MIEKEYLSVAEISKQRGMTTRNVRRIISELSETKNEELLRKDKNNKWEVHQLLKPQFKRQRNRKQQYFAFSIDANKNLTTNDIKQIMKHAFGQVDDEELEINYTIESKKTNGQLHVHSYIKSPNKKVEILKTLKLLFENLSYHESKIFDLERWKLYITKDGSPIITLKKDE